MRLIGFIPFTRRLLTQKRLEDECRARNELRPITNNVRKIAPARTQSPGA